MIESRSKINSKTLCKVRDLDDRWCDAFIDAYWNSPELQSDRFSKLFQIPIVCFYLIDAFLHFLFNDLKMVFFIGRNK